LETARDGFRKRQRFVGMLHEAGARLLAGTDCFGLASTCRAGLQNELALLVESGLSPLAALRAATVTAADALGQSETLGTLESGKLADIVVLEATRWRIFTTPARADGHQSRGRCASDVAGVARITVADRVTARQRHYARTRPALMTVRTRRAL